MIAVVGCYIATAVFVGEGFVCALLQMQNAPAFCLPMAGVVLTRSCLLRLHRLGIFSRVMELVRVQL